MTTEACPERSVFKRLVQFIGLVLFSLARTRTRALSVLPALSTSSFPPQRRFQRSDGGGLVPRRVLSILCIVEQLRPTPRIQAICEYMLALCFVPPLFRPSPSVLLSHSLDPFLVLFLLCSLCPSRSRPVRLSFFFRIASYRAARTSFRAPWGCKCIRDDGRVLPE